MRIVHVIGGGTFENVSPHLSLAAPAFGTVARAIVKEIASKGRFPDHEVKLWLTRMADPASAIVTNDDVGALLDRLVDDPRSHVIFLSAALCDFRGVVAEPERRRESRAGEQQMKLVPAEKLVARIRSTRKDLFLVAFKTTAGATADDQFFAGLRLLRESHANLVLANDLRTRKNMTVVPEKARYHVTTDRAQAIAGLVEMADLRSRLRFTRSTVVPGENVPWSLAPASLRAVVDHCVARGAYAPFMGSTAGHFAARIGPSRFLTSRRWSNFNENRDLVVVDADGDDAVVAHGARPSVGGQSQRIVFTEHPDVDCIVHFHSPMRPGSPVPVRSQRAFECGSHECGENTSKGLTRFGSLKAVMLDRHGPNAAFHHDVAPESVIRFLEENFDLSKQTSFLAEPEM
ncbi:MAG: class II aldolase/adducin family protein [Polyangiales bacterium]